MHTSLRSALAAGLLLLAACSGPAPQGEGILAEPRRHSPREEAFDVEHYALDLAVDPAAETLRGTCTVRLWPREHALDSVALDLVGLEVERVTDGDGRVLAFAHVGGVLRIRLAQPLEVGDFVELAVAYGGHPVRGLWFADREQGVARHVFTQGECEDARCWFPCWDAPSDRATSEVRVTMPGDWTAVAAGERVDRGTLPDGRAFEHWRMPTPHPTYLVTLVAGEFEVVDDVWDGVPLEYLGAPEYANDLQRAFASTADVLQYFSEVTGKRYPYSKYSQACVANFPFGGMENISATTMTDTILRDERGDRDYDPSSLVAHEAAHQWFGDLLTTRDWSHVWLNESFATYFALLYMEHARGEEAFRAGVADMQESYLAGDVGEGRRPIVWGVYRDPMDLFFGGQVYPGGASRLHLLRFVLGDDAFFAGIRGYVADNAGRGVVTRDFQTAMERASGRDLEAFFDTWLRSPGFPEFEWSWTWEPDASRVVVEVHQVQDPSDGTPEVFSTPVELAACGMAWEEDARVELTERSQRFELPCRERPAWVHFDRHGWIPKVARVRRSLDEWLAIAARDTDVNARREAVRAIGAGLVDARSAAEGRASTLALIDRLVADEQEAVRKEAARALGASATTAARSTLQSAARSDEVAAVRVVALDALRGRGADEELAAFAAEQYAAGYSWEVMGAAARLMASADPHGAHDWLAARLDTDSPHDVLRASLFEALRLAGDPRALDLLRRWALDPEAGSASRTAAVAALGRMGAAAASLRPAFEELLASTGSYRLQSALIEALGQLADRRSVPALEAYYHSCEDSRQRRAVEAVLRNPWARPGA